MKQYFSSVKTAAVLKMTPRRVTGLCQEGKLEGAVREGRSWKIPEESVHAYAEAEGIVTESAPERRSDDLLPCAVGNTSYAEIVKECYYVDKTLLIRDLIDDHNMVTLFTRPRRFGKTLTINMLKTFFEKTGEDTSGLFRDKKIWQCGEKYRNLQGKYPVVMLTFKDVKYENMEESMQALRLEIKDEYNRHAELKNSAVIRADDRDYLERMENGTLSDVEYSRALLNLTRMLSAHYQQKCIILIDEYDTPVQQGYSKGFYQEIISFMRNFLSGGLKDNANLAFGVLTGIMRVSKENLFSGLNNPVVNTVLDEKYSTYFGFTEEEVREMADYYGKSDRLEEIRTWYDGYCFGGTYIYNPWSVTNYFANGGQAKAFWANTSDNEIIREMMQDLTPEVAGELTRVLQGEDIHAFLNMEVVYPRISDGADTIFSFLLLAGYLTPSAAPEETETGTLASLRLPNKEIRRVYNAEILSWLRTKTGGGVVSEIEKAVYLRNGDRLQKALEGYMISCISCFDGSAEGFYHGMMVGLAAGLSSRYYIRSNRESGEGRFDLQLEPKEKNLPGIVMEFKTADTSEPEELSAKAEEALAQIDRKRYISELQDHGIRNIVKYGIAFAGKRAEVRTETA